MAGTWCYQSMLFTEEQYVCTYTIHCTCYNIVQMMIPFHTMNPMFKYTFLAYKFSNIVSATPYKSTQSPLETYACTHTMHNNYFLRTCATNQKYGWYYHHYNNNQQIRRAEVFYICSTVFKDENEIFRFLKRCFILLFVLY